MTHTQSRQATKLTRDKNINSYPQFCRPHVLAPGTEHRYPKNDDAFKMRSDTLHMLRELRTLRVQYLCQSILKDCPVIG
jgi:hypothetical protein